MTYEMKEPGFVVVWWDQFERATIWGPIEPDAIQDFIDAYPEDEYDDVIGYSPSDLAVNLGEMFSRVDAPFTEDGNYDFWVNDPAGLNKDRGRRMQYRVTMVPTGDVEDDNASAREWAKKNGIAVASRGPVSSDVMQDYRSAMMDEMEAS